MSTSEEDLIIHLEWDGPYSLESVAHLEGPTDHGVYQIYGCHPVYGSSCLLYIGLAAAQTFSTRINQEWHWPISQDAGRVEIYVGRLHGSIGTPNNDVWERQIELAEKLLIFAHSPARNSKSILHLEMEAELQKVHVLNFSRHRDLLPEVSSARWSKRFQEIPGWRAYTTADFIK